MLLPHSPHGENDHGKRSIQAKGEVLPCPKCGQAPRIIGGIIGGCYMACLGHAETRLVDTREEAVRLWNEGELEA